MNKWFTVFLAFFAIFSVGLLQTQPQVSYILPDIGAPAMNVYVEFVSPYNLKGNFGTDGLYLNNPGDQVRVLPANIADADKVKIGPVVVSWEGRLISTQVFINPELEPNSTDALTVRPEFRIPLVVEVNGQKSNEQLFYVVLSRPYFDGTGNAGQTVFGVGALGTRSPRGAMIFDSLKLGNFTYTVSTADCDPNTTGNQGFLPFVLLVKGKVIGGGTSSSILSVDAPGINAGPGGGGGGGRFYDGAAGNGDNGGDGFVGGGAGGRNNAGLPLVSNAFRNPGSGTGAGGNSINGVPFPPNAAYESVGGGTGHPFGSSGISCNNANNCNPPGEYGGGSGINQVRQGGAGGYGSEGDGFGGAGGKEHGNAMNIPLAGGSGGASGNPQGIGVFAGNGGGGGGAVTLFATEISNLKISAKGADGFDFSGLHVNLERTPEPFGGSGSGGAVNLLSKLTLNNNIINIDGGLKNSRRGGIGRLRIDGFDSNEGGIVETSDAGFDGFRYKGISTDTTQYVKRQFILTGTQNPNVNSKLYFASFDGNWAELPNNLDIDAEGNWDADIQLISDAPYVCLVAMQEVPNNATGEYLQDPIRVMSQAAANLFILDLSPILVADTVAENLAITCIGYERFIETEIKNDDLAGGTLEFNLSNNNWIFGNNGFEIVEPLGDVILEPGESITLKVKFFWSGGQKENIINRLFFNHNDPAKQNPWIIEFRVGDAYQPRMEFIGLESDFIFPDTRIGGVSTRNISLRNIGESLLRIEEINPINPPFYVVGTDKPLPAVLKPGEELLVRVEFRPTSDTSYKAAISALSIVTDTTCSFFAFQMLEGTGVFSSIDVNVTEIDFGLVPWCDERSQIISIQNSSSASFTLNSAAVIEGDNPEAFIITNPKTPPITITPGDGTQFNIRINGKDAGDGVKTAVFRITTDVPETPVIEVRLRAEVVGFEVFANPANINLGLVDIGFDIDASVVITNNSRLPQQLFNATSNNTASISLPAVQGDVITQNGGNYPFNFTINTTNQPQNSVITIAFDDPCEDTIRIPITANYAFAKESAFEGMEGNPVFWADTTKIDTLDFGQFSPCEAGELKLIKYTNTSQGRYVVLSEALSNSGIEAFFYVGSGLNHPDTIQASPNSKSGAQLFFDPENLPEGTYFAEYLVEIYINGQYVTRKVVLKAEVVEGKYDNTPEISQMLSVVGLTEERELIIRNNGPYEIEITGFDIPANPVFTLSSNLLGIIIPAGSEERFTVSFSPDAVDFYNDSIIVKILIGGCIREFVFYLEGEGIPSKKVHLSVPQMIVEPTLNNFRIPVYAKLEDKDDNLAGFEIESLKITMHRSVFYPQAIIGGTLINSSLNGENRIIEFKIDNITISRNDSLIAEIEGSTLLGDVDFTNIVFSDIQYSMKTLVGEITSSNGSMRTEICNEGGDRLLRISGMGTSVAVNPNPATEKININAVVIEKGVHSIDIVDAVGRITKVTEFTNSEAGEMDYSISVPATGLPSGTYILKLQTPTEVIALQFVILN
ncbi:MAG: choice-of-anchor D domain-containing protein [Candidatus Kapabacteria bacterium]|nr:choice-of-anchor D domain-containing protein [Ignavibacteriota bacterium]MCW5884202.1 choice-of-anchor D domain-containing protein [Candidatus Kapabacteria bacterium]